MKLRKESLGLVTQIGFIVFNALSLHAWLVIVGFAEFQLVAVVNSHSHRTLEASFVLVLQAHPRDTVLGLHLFGILKAVR